MLLKKSIFLSLFLILAACRTPPPDLPPDEIVQAAASRMSALSGFHFVIERSGAPAYVDPPDNRLVFRRAEGDFSAPDRARAVVRIIGPGLVTEVNVVSVAEIQWQTNVLTGQWEELPPDWGFNPTVLFDTAMGLQAVLRQDLTSLELAGIGPPPDGPKETLYKVTGRAAGDRLYEMSGQLIGPQPVRVTLWIRPGTFELVQTEVIETGPDAEEPSTWLVIFSQFDQAVPIQPPAID